MNIFPLEIYQLIFENIDDVVRHILNISLVCKLFSQHIKLSVKSLNMNKYYKLNYNNMSGFYIREYFINDNILQEFKFLNSLDLSNCSHITDNGIKNLTNLISLNLDNNNGITDNGIKNLTNLKSLSLQYNNSITYNVIKELTNITSLDLYNNKKMSKYEINDLFLNTKISINIHEVNVNNIFM